MLSAILKKVEGCAVMFCGIALGVAMSKAGLVVNGDPLDWFWTALAGLVVASVAGALHPAKEGQNK